MTEEKKGIDDGRYIATAVQGIPTPFVGIHEDNKLKVLVAIDPFLLFTS